MRIYFSGGRGLRCVPECLAAERKPHIMLTFHDIGSNGTLDRLNVYLERKYQIVGKNAEKPSTKVDHPLYTESIFMDSGAYSLYGLHVGETKSILGEHGRKLDRVKRKRWGAGDYSYYSLAPGSEFRRYCDRYAALMNKLKHTDVLFTTVDAIQNPQVSWHVQQYFEKEHGLRPIPVIHSKTPNGTRWLARYVEAGHKMVGFGGLGQQVRVNDYRPWANEMWRLICPASNKHKPIVRVHGFAMTSWGFMTEWPWWSVDSATWIKLAAYGWIVVPPYKEGHGFRHDVPPLQINMSRKPTERKQKFWWRLGVKGPRQMKDRHYDNAKQYYRESTDRWLAHLKMDIGAFRGETTFAPNSFGVYEEMSAEGAEILEKGVGSDFRMRAMANLQYFADFQASLPTWPSPLRHEVLEEAQKIEYRRGLGL